MNKTDLIKAIAPKVELPQAKVAEVLDAALEAAVAAVKKGEKVQLVGYATIAVVNKSARKAKNPRTGAVVNIPAKKAVKIKAGAKFAL